MSRLASILVALWAGSLWTVCGIVAPSLFAALEDRHQAGQLAARFFRIEAWMGLAIGVVLIATLVIRKALARSMAAVWLVVLTAGAPMISELALGPMMDSARAANDMGRFGMLHGVAGGLFLVACLGALALIWIFSSKTGNRPAE